MGSVSLFQMRKFPSFGRAMTGVCAIIPSLDSFEFLDMEFFNCKSNKLVLSLNQSRPLINKSTPLERQKTCMLITWKFH